MLPSPYSFPKSWHGQTGYLDLLATPDGHQDTEVVITADTAHTSQQQAWLFPTGAGASGKDTLPALIFLLRTSGWQHKEIFCSLCEECSVSQVKKIMQGAIWGTGIPDFIAKLLLRAGQISGIALLVERRQSYHAQGDHLEMLCAGCPAHSQPCCSISLAQCKMSKGYRKVSLAFFPPHLFLSSFWTLQIDSEPTCSSELAGGPGLCTWCPPSRQPPYCSLQSNV